LRLRCTYWYVQTGGVDTRERLVETMSELMWERGYADTSPRAVRERAGVGQGSLYHHFPTKRDLALAALERNVADLLPAASELDGPGDPMARIEAYLMRPRDALKGCKVGRMTQDPQVREDPVLLAPVARAFAQVHASWVKVLREAVAAGELRDDLDPGRLAHTLMAILQGGYVLAIAQQDPGPFDDARAGALDLLRAAGPSTSNGKNHNRK
jgi:TetR/AcrR family transcriptional regulator, transcriptional repressor for nem operon